MQPALCGFAEIVVEGGNGAVENHKRSDVAELLVAEGCGGFKALSNANVIDVRLLIDGFAGTTFNDCAISGSPLTIIYRRDFAAVFFELYAHNSILLNEKTIELRVVDIIIGQENTPLIAAAVVFPQTITQDAELLPFVRRAIV
jgi:hypothetical protein